MDFSKLMPRAEEILARRQEDLESGMLQINEFGIHEALSQALVEQQLDDARRKVDILEAELNKFAVERCREAYEAAGLDPDPQGGPELEYVTIPCMLCNGQTEGCEKCNFTGQFSFDPKTTRMVNADPEKGHVVQPK